MFCYLQILIRPRKAIKPKILKRSQNERPVKTQQSLIVAFANKGINRIPAKRPVLSLKSRKSILNLTESYKDFFDWVDILRELS